MDGLKGGKSEAKTLGKIERGVQGMAFALKVWPLLYRWARYPSGAISAVGTIIPAGNRQNLQLPPEVLPGSRRQNIR